MKNTLLDLVNEPEKIRVAVMNKSKLIVACEYVVDPRKKNYFFFIIRTKKNKRWGVSFNIKNRGAIGSLLYNLKDLK